MLPPEDPVSPPGSPDTPSDSPETAAPSADPPESSAADSELREYLSGAALRRRLFPRAALVGIASGVVAVAFRAVLTGGDWLRDLLIARSHALPALGWLLPLLLAASGAALSVAAVRRFAPEAAGSGIPHLEAVLHRYRDLRWKRVLAVKFGAGAVALASGLALGREGPTVQMGGAVGAAVAERLGSSPRERLTLIAAGAGAGLSAAFNAPLSGLVFVLEEVQKDFRPAVFGAAFVAAAVADILARSVSGSLPAFQVPGYPAPPLETLPLFAVLGVVCGLLGVGFNRGLVGVLNVAGRIPAKRRVLAAALVGTVVGGVAWFAPQAVGPGHALTERMLSGDAPLATLPLWLALRFVLCLASYGTGAPGGIFAPLLALGSIAGLGVGQSAHTLAPTLVPQAGVFAVVGMAACFTAIVRAPLTGVVLILEMTGSYAQMLPLLVACFAAYAVAEGLREMPIYEHLLERDLRRRGVFAEIREPIVVEYEVEPGAPFAGRRLRDLGLPPGCVLVHLVEEGRELVPTADTVLHAHTRLSAVVSPEAERALPMLREGCSRPDDP